MVSAKAPVDLYCFFFKYSFGYLFQTEMKIQFKDLYNRMKRMETIMIAITGASLLLLIRMSIMG